MSAFELALANLLRRKIPTWIALISISLSVAFSGVLFRLYLLSGSRFSTLVTGPQAVIGAKAGGLELLLSSLNLEGPLPDSIPFKLYASLQNRAAVQFEDGVRSEPNYIKSVVPIVFFGKYLSYRAMGTNESFLKQPTNEAPHLQMGRWAENRNEVVLGAGVSRAEKLMLTSSFLIQDWSAEQSPVTAGTYATVVGILEPTGKATDYGIYSNLETAWERVDGYRVPEGTPSRDKRLHFFLVYLEPNGFSSLSALINRRTVAQVIDVNDQITRLKNLTGAGRKIGFFLSFLILFLGGLGVTAMMVTRFDAMTLQLAVLRALGYGKKTVRNWLLWEGALIGIAACLMGGLLDFAFFPLIRDLLGEALPMNAGNAASIYQSALVWFISLTGTILAVFIPLYRLYHTDIHEALKG